MKNAVAMLFLFCLGGFARDTASRKLDVLWAKLAQQIELEDARLDGVMGVAIVDLTDHREWTLRANEVFPTASTIKLAVLAELFHQEELSRQG